MAWIFHGNSTRIECIFRDDSSIHNIHSSKTKYSHLSGRGHFIFECIDFPGHQCDWPIHPVCFLLVNAYNNLQHNGRIQVLHFKWRFFFHFSQLTVCTISLCSAEIARGCVQGSYGLIFGVITLLGIWIRIALLKIMEALGDSSLNLNFNLWGVLVLFAGFTYILFMVMCKSRTSQAGVVLSTRA